MEQLRTRQLVLPCSTCSAALAVSDHVKRPISVGSSLKKTFTDEQKETFEKFHDCWNEYMSLAEAAIFEYAFKLGARLAMEVQSDKDE